MSADGVAPMGALSMSGGGNERRVIARLIGRGRVPTSGIFELASGERVEVGGAIGLESPDAPTPGEKVFLVIDQSGEAIRWEPYPDPRRGEA